MEHALAHFAAEKALDKVLKYIDKAPEENLIKMIELEKILN